MHKKSVILGAVIALAGCEPAPSVSPSLCIGSVCIDGQFSEGTEFDSFEWPSDQAPVSTEADAAPAGEPEGGKSSDANTTFGNNPETLPFVDATFETCFDLVPCMNACSTLGSDESCIEECVKRATEFAMFTWNALHECSTDLCGDYAGEDLDTCVFMNCAEPAGACYLNGENTCAEVLHCSASCGNEEDCKIQCSQEMSPEAYVHQSQLTGCWADICSQGGWICQMAQLFTCTAEASECGLLGKTGHSCTEAVNCMISCTSGTCLLNCMQETHPLSAALAGDYLLCLHEECGDSPTNICIQNAKADACADTVNSCALDQ